jgi:hypothetical protein
MADHRRISSTASPSIPPAPPPPPPKIKSRSYFERFVNPLQSAAYASRPPSVQAHGANADVAPLNPLVPKLLGYVYFHSSTSICICTHCTLFCSGSLPLFSSCHSLRLDTAAPLPNRVTSVVELVSCTNTVRPALATPPSHDRIDLRRPLD